MCRWWLNIIRWADRLLCRISWYYEENGRYELMAQASCRWGNDSWRKRLFLCCPNISSRCPCCIVKRGDACKIIKSVCRRNATTTSGVTKRNARKGAEIGKGCLYRYLTSSVSTIQKAAPQWYHINTKAAAANKWSRILPFDDLDF